MIAAAILIGACGSNAMPKQPNALATVEATTTTAKADPSTRVVTTTMVFSDGTAPTTTVTTTKPTTKASTAVTIGSCAPGFARLPGTPGGCAQIHTVAIADCAPGYENPPGDSGTCVPKTTTTA